MVPVIAASGGSFKGAHAYYFHDKNARTSERVAWTQTVNMLTDCAEKAWKVMAYTAKNQSRLKEASGRKSTRAKSKKPVFAYSLSWHPEQTPDRDAMLSAVRASLEKLGLDEHQAMIAAHTDEPQPHVHIVVNTIHPMTGLVAKLKFTKRRLSDFAREYQKEEGTNYCPRREENYQKRQKGVNTKYVDPIILKAWQSTTDGNSFAKALKIDGYQLAQGRKRIVVIDRNGKTVNPLRHLLGVSSSELKDRISDLTLEYLQMVEESKQRITLAKTDRKIEKTFHHDTTSTSPDSKRVERSLRNKERIAVLVAEQEHRHTREREQIIANYSETAMGISARFGIDKTRAEIHALQIELAKQGFWRRLFRLNQRILGSIDMLEAKLTQSKHRLAKELATLRARLILDLERANGRQTNEREKLKERLENRYPRTLNKGNLRAKEIDNSRKQQLRKQCNQELER